MKECGRQAMELLKKVVQEDFLYAVRYAVVEKMDAETVARIWAKDFDRINFKHRGLLRPYLAKFLMAGEAEPFKQALLTIYRGLTTDALIGGARKALSEWEPGKYLAIKLVVHWVEECDHWIYDYFTEGGSIRVEAMMTKDPLVEWDFEDFEYRAKVVDIGYPVVHVERVGGWPNIWGW